MARTVTIATAGATPRQYDFDGVFDASATSSEVFDELKPLTRKVASGCSACVLAYGQTGSGKTHTVSALHELVVAELLTQSASHGVGAGGAKIAVCIAEVYLDHVRDLAPAPGCCCRPMATACRMARSRRRGRPCVTEQGVGVRRCCRRAARHRRPASTRARAARTSSSCMRCSVPTASGAVSSRWSTSRAGAPRARGATGERRDEAVSIASRSRRSVTCSPLWWPRPSTPYRNSKLTSLLQPCLKRGCRVALIGCVAGGDRRD